MIEHAPRRPRAALAAVALVSATFVTPRPAIAEPTEVPGPTVAAVPSVETKWRDLARASVRVLTYDRTFTRRASFVVATRQRNRVSTICGTEMMQALDAALGAVPSRRLRPQLVTFDPATFGVDLKRLDAGVVYLCPGLENDPSVIAVTQRHRVLSIGAAPTVAAVGLAPHGTFGAIGIVLRVDRARAEGARFTTPLLGYAHRAR